MTHFAKIKDGIVKEVIVAEQDFINTLPNKNDYVQTSYNTRKGVHYDPTTNLPSSDQSKALRKNYAVPGFIYDSERDAFYPQKKYDNWILNENTCQWESPIPYPNDGNDYEWNVTYQRWDLVVYKDPLLYKR